MTPHDSLPDLQAMRAGVAYHFQIRIRNWKCTLRPITVSEHMSINAEILQQLSQMPPNVQNPVNENYLLAKGFLKASSKLDPNGTTEPALNDYLLDAMNVDEVLYAYQQYLDGVERINPRLEDMKPEELIAMAEEVKKNPSTATALSSWELTNLVRYLATKHD